MYEKYVMKEVKGMVVGKEGGMMGLGELWGVWFGVELGERGGIVEEGVGLGVKGRKEVGLEFMVNKVLNKE